MSKEADFSKLRERLEKDFTWPLVYMFKFIVPGVNKKIALVLAKFSEEAIITQRQSRKGKYISITVKVVMLNAESVIDKYKEVATIEGVITL